MAMAAITTAAGLETHTSRAAGMFFFFSFFIIHYVNVFRSSKQRWQQQQTATELETRHVSSRWYDFFFTLMTILG